MSAYKWRGVSANEDECVQAKIGNKSEGEWTQVEKNAYKLRWTRTSEDECVQEMESVQVKMSANKWRGVRANEDERVQMKIGK